MKRILFLGTGASAGVPVIGCRCAICLSTDPCNKRTRPSLLLEAEGKKIVIDVGPDFRTQALRHHLDIVEGVLLTHSHSDHIAGIDDLRIYYLRTKKKLPLIASSATMRDLTLRYPYLMEAREEGKGSLTAQLEWITLAENRGEFSLAGLPFRFFSYEQSAMMVTGFRYQNFAYVVDIRSYPETIFDDLAGVEVLVVSSLGPRPSYMHFSFDEARAFIEKVGAREGYLTHLSHDIDHHEGNKYFSKTISLAYDGLSVEL